jgi:hypothetical protein
VCVASWQRLTIRQGCMTWPTSSQLPPSCVLGCEAAVRVLNDGRLSLERAGCFVAVLKLWLTRELSHRYRTVEWRWR